MGGWGAWGASNALEYEQGDGEFGRCKRLLKPGGIYCSSELGPLSENPILALIAPLMRGKRSYFLFHTMTRR